MSADIARVAFVNAAAGRLKLKHFGLTYENSRQIMTATGFHADGLPFAVATGRFDGNPITRARDLAISIIAAHQGLPSPPRQETRRVASPSAVAERLKKLRETIAAESDKVMDEIEAAEKTDVPAAFTHARTVLGNHRSELESMKADLAQLTNLPLDGSSNA